MNAMLSTDFSLYLTYIWSYISYVDANIHFNENLTVAQTGTGSVV